MILYRIIDEEEYNSIKNGTLNLLEKIPANRFLGDINRVYESDNEENNNQYLYFFEDVSACENGWNGKYIIQVDIPEEILEKGYGRYASISSCFSRYITMDEYRIKKEDFIPAKHLLGIADKEEIPEEWYATSEKYREAIVAATSQVYFALNYYSDKIEKVDASGLRGEALKDFIVPEELNGIITKVNETLYKSIENLDEIRTYEYDPNNRSAVSHGRSTIQAILQKMSKIYSPKQISSLFDGNISRKRVFDIFNIMETSEIQEFEKGIEIGDYNRNFDLKFMVASILAKSDTSKEDYEATRDNICAFFDEYGDIRLADDDVKQAALEFIFLDGTKFDSFEWQYNRYDFIQSISDFFAHCPKNAKDSATYLFGEENTSQASTPNKHFRRSIDDKVKCFECVYKNIEEYNSNNKENNISINSIIDLFKRLDKIGIELNLYNKKVREFLKSGQILELLTQSKDNPDYDKHLLTIFEQLDAIPKETSARPKKLPYSDKRIAEGVANINPHDLEIVESSIENEKKD